MNEYNYHDIRTPFPTLARGLFFMELPESNGKNGEKRYHIVVRAMTSSLISERFLGPMCEFVFVAHSRRPLMFVDQLRSSRHWKHELPPPYTLTLKSNSCIIFIAALSPTQLVITLKHSLGAHNDSEKSHGCCGEVVREIFKRKGKNEERVGEDVMG